MEGAKYEGRSSTDLNRVIEYGPLSTSRRNELERQTPAVHAPSFYEPLIASTAERFQRRSETHHPSDAYLWVGELASFLVL